MVMTSIFIHSFISFFLLNFICILGYIFTPILICIFQFSRCVFSFIFIFNNNLQQRMHGTGDQMQDGAGVPLFITHLGNLGGRPSIHTNVFLCSNSVFPDEDKPTIWNK